MKTRILKIALLAAGLASLVPVSLTAQITGDIEADIPFKFIVNQTTLGPGKYIIRPVDSSSLEIVGPAGHASVFVLTETTTAKTEPAKTELMFNRHGDQEFLSKIFVAGERDGVELVKSPLEKKLDGSGPKHVEHPHPATLQTRSKKKTRKS